VGIWVTGGGGGWQSIRGSSGKDLSVLVGRFGVDTPSDLWVATPTTLLDPEHLRTMILASIRNHLSNTLSCA